MFDIHPAILTAFGILIAAIALMIWINSPDRREQHK